MKIILWLSLSSILLCFSMNLQAQTYDSTSAVITFGSGPDTIYHQFTNCLLNPYTDGTLTVYTDGDFGAGSEYFMIIGDDTLNLGNQYNPPSNTDCPGFLDALQITIPLATLTNWVADGNVDIWFVTSSDVDDFCNNLVQLQLTYESCPFGTPVAFAAISGAPAATCETNQNLDLSSFGTPAGGTFSGVGVNGTSLDATQVSGSSTTIFYSYTDMIGCETTASATINLVQAAGVADFSICPDSSATIMAPTGFGEIALYSTAQIATPIATGEMISTPNLTETTIYYIASNDSMNIFSVDTLMTSDSMVVDHDVLTGDDRGGIAVSANYVYVVGDNNSARYDLDLTNGIVLPRRDGIFSNLETGQVWTLDNSTVGPPDNYPNPYIVDQLTLMDDSLNLSSTTVPLSMPVDMSNVGNVNGGIFSGYGFIILYSDNLSTWYAINIGTGAVTEINNTFVPNFYYSENWADWGMAEFDGVDYSVVYRPCCNSEIARTNLSTNTTTTPYTFSSISDLSSFVIDPTQNRWYFHYEGSGQFGGTSETLGYADAGFSVSAGQPLANNACRDELVITINEIDLGADQTICDNESYTLVADPGFLTYSWNGNNNNLNSFEVTAAGDYDLAVTDVDGCVLKDTVTVATNPAPVVDLGGAVFICTSGTDTLDAGAGYSAYNWSNGETTQNIVVDASTLNVGTNSFEVTVTDANGCEGEDEVFVLVDICAGIGDLSEAAMVTLAPNPNNGQFYVEIQGYEGDEDMQLTVVNAVGQVIHQEQFIGNTYINRTIDISSYPAGMYMLRIQSENTSWMQKVVKH